ncbi:MAG TPA: hypothetical protein VF834_18850, partial [Streptosporangiaceae bacterium]
MGYALRMSGEIRDWLTGLGRDDPDDAKAVGYALVALLSEGGNLGPPVVTAATRPPPADPAEALDEAYQLQLDQLGTLRRLAGDAASLVHDMQARLDRLAPGADTATATAPEREQAAELRQLLPGARDNARELTEASRREQAVVDAFRVRKEVLSSTYTAAQVQVQIAEAMAALESDAGGAEGSGEPRESESARESGRAADSGLAGDSVADAARVLQEVTAEITRELHRGNELGDLQVLRPAGSAGPGHLGIRIIFAVEPAGMALLISVLEGVRSGSAEYREAVAVSAGILRQVRAGQDPEASACAFDDVRPFLDAFFPEDAGDLEVGAAALVRQ